MQEAVYYTEEEVERQASALLLDGMDAIEAQIRNEVGDGELLSKKIYVQEKNGALVIGATIEYTKNIAERLSLVLGDG